MSKLSSSIKAILRGHILPGKRVLELFPGCHKDSIEFLYYLTGKKITAIGGEDKPHSFHLRYYEQTIPPYPRFFRKFDYIFLNEAEWIICAEHGYPVDYSKFPTKGIEFIQTNLKKNGKFVISKIHKEVARLILKWLNLYGKYSLSYKKNVAVFTKNR